MKKRKYQNRFFSQKEYDNTWKLREAEKNYEQQKGTDVGKWVVQVTMITEDNIDSNALQGLIQRKT